MYNCWKHKTINWTNEQYVNYWIYLVNGCCAVVVCFSVFFVFSRYVCLCTVHTHIPLTIMKSLHTIRLPNWIETAIWIRPNYFDIIHIYIHTHWTYHIFYAFYLWIWSTNHRINRGNHFNLYLVYAKCGNFANNLGPKVNRFLMFSLAFDNEQLNKWIEQKNEQTNERTK